MSSIKILISAAIVSGVCMVVKHYKPEYSMLCEACSVVFILYFAFSFTMEISENLKSVSESWGLDFSFLEILFKALIISLVTDVSVSLCEDSGNNAIARIVDFFGKTVIVMMSLPMIQKVVEIAVEFIQ